MVFQLQQLHNIAIHLENSRRRDRENPRQQKGANGQINIDPNLHNTKTTKDTARETELRTAHLVSRRPPSGIATPRASDNSIAGQTPRRQVTNHGHLQRTPQLQTPKFSGTVPLSTPQLQRTVQTRTPKPPETAQPNIPVPQTLQYSRDNYTIRYQLLQGTSDPNDHAPGTTNTTKQQPRRSPKQWPVSYLGPTETKEIAALKRIISRIRYVGRLRIDQERSHRTKKRSTHTRDRSSDATRQPNTHKRSRTQEDTEGAQPKAKAANNQHPHTKETPTRDPRTMRPLQELLSQNTPLSIRIKIR